MAMEILTSPLISALRYPKWAVITKKWAPPQHNSWDWKNSGVIPFSSASIRCQSVEVKSS